MNSLAVVDDYCGQLNVLELQEPGVLTFADSAMCTGVELVWFRVVLLK